METINVTIPEEDIRRMADFLGPLASKLAKAFAASANATTAHMGKKITARVRTVEGVPVAISRLRIKRPQAIPGTSRDAHLLAGKIGWPLKQFPHQQNQTGVVARVGAKSRVYPHAFVSPALGEHVFVRVGKPRLPIRKVYVPSPTDVMQADTTESIIASEAQLYMTNDLTRRVNALALELGDNP